MGAGRAAPRAFRRRAGRDPRRLLRALARAGRGGRDPGRRARRSGAPDPRAGRQAEPDFVWLYLLRGYASGQLGVRRLKLAKALPDRDAAQRADAEFQFEEAEEDFRTAEGRLRRQPDPDLNYVLLVNRGLIRF